MRKREVKAVLFDLDGVLINSIWAWFHIFNDTLKYFKKKSLSRNQFKKIFGMSIDVAAKKYFNESKVKEIEHIYFGFFKSRIIHFKLFKHSMPILKEIKKLKLKTALITNSPDAMVYKILRQTRLKKYFDVVVTIDDVKKGKPQPDIVLKACKILKVKPGETLLVGDTKNDMIAGKRAGCITVGYKIKGDFSIDNLISITSFLK